MFEQSATVSINNLGENDTMVNATSKKLTIVSADLHNVRLPAHDERTVELVINICMFVRIRFRSAAHSSAFRRALGNLAENDSSDSCEESNSSLSTEGSQTSFSSTDLDMMRSTSEL